MDRDSSAIHSGMNTSQNVMSSIVPLISPSSSGSGGHEPNSIETEGLEHSNLDQTGNESGAIILYNQESVTSAKSFWPQTLKNNAIRPNARSDSICNSLLRNSDSHVIVCNTNLDNTLHNITKVLSRKEYLQNSFLWHRPSELSLNCYQIMHKRSMKFIRKRKKRNRTRKLSRESDLWPPITFMLKYNYSLKLDLFENSNNHGSEMLHLERSLSAYNIHFLETKMRANMHKRWSKKYDESYSSEMLLNTFTICFPMNIDCLYIIKKNVLEINQMDIFVLSKAYSIDIIYQNEASFKSDQTYRHQRICLELSKPLKSNEIHGYNEALYKGENNTRNSKFSTTLHIKRIDVSLETNLISLFNTHQVHVEGKIRCFEKVLKCLSFYIQNQQNINDESSCVNSISKFQNIKEEIILGEMNIFAFLLLSVLRDRYEKTVPLFTESIGTRMHQMYEVANGRGCFSECNHGNKEHLLMNKQGDINQKDPKLFEFWSLQQETSHEDSQTQTSPQSTFHLWPRHPPDRLSFFFHRFLQALKTLNTQADSRPISNCSPPTLLCLEHHLVPSVTLIGINPNSADGLDEQYLDAAFHVMDWMRHAGSDVMISDDQLTAALQHLLVSVEKGIERLEWDTLSKPWTSTSVCGVSHEPATLSRCCGTHVSTKDCSVQTNPEDDTTQDHDEDDQASQLTSEKDISEDTYALQKQCKEFGDGLASETCDPEETTTLDLNSAAKAMREELMFGLQVAEDSHLRDEDPDDGYCEHVLTQPATIGQVDADLLHSQVALLPGCRDVKKRSVVVISSQAFRDNPQASACHLAQLLLYFHTIPKKEVMSKGFLVLIEGADHSEDFWNILDEAFCLIEANVSNAISEVLLLFEAVPVPELVTLFPTSRVQCEVLLSSDQLLNYIKKDQLLARFGGTYVYDHQEWISFRKFLEPFINGCRLSGRHLVGLLEELRGSRLPVSSNLTHQLIERQKRTVSHTFRDEQLRHLEEEGDTVLKELDAYRRKCPNNYDYRENLERTNVLYDELRKAMVKLARLADKRLIRLEECLQLKTFQEESSQVLSWLCKKGRESLEKHQALADSLGGIKQQEEEFEKFYFLAMRQIEKGNDLLEEVSTLSNEPTLTIAREENPAVCEEEGSMQELAVSLRQHLGSFSERLEGTRERIEDTAKCYQLLDKSYEWALDAMRFVSHMGIADTGNPDAILRQIKCLQDYLEDHLQIPEDTFADMLELTTRLGNEKLLEQCKIVKLRCQETVELVNARQATLLKVKQQMEVDTYRSPHWEAEDTILSPRTTRSHSQPMNNWLPSGTSTPYFGGAFGHQRRRSTGGALVPSSSQRYGSPLGSYTSFPSSYYPTARDSYQDSYIQEREDQLLNNGLITEDLTAQGPVASISKSLLDSRVHRDGHSSSSSSSASSTSSYCSKESASPFSSIRGSISSSHKRWTKKHTRRCQAWQLRDEALEKAKAQVREQTALLRVERLHSMREGGSSNSSETECSPSSDSCCKVPIGHTRSEPIRGPVPVNTHLTQTTSVDVVDTGDGSDILSDSEVKSKKTLMLIMKEMIQTERDYVKSLEYIIESYIPELTREDIPQALRGQRNVVFGNIEKIYEFHNQYFLNELELCEHTPFNVGHCFQNFEPQFYLYALYNKNKPKSDALMSEYGNMFFRRKQLELQDKMNLASYLLKPVQRMGKYALLLKQLLKECPETEVAHQSLKEAEEMVRFQLRHGNDLLAMDALRDCDVNVKEQGRLLRQDEFIVWQGRSKKSMRRVFLFEDLILFSKARRDPQRKGYEMYQYKHSIKTTDMGLTEQIGDSPTKFEIWFRKRKLNDTYLLQAPNPEIKIAWVQELFGLLWKQALRNREMRLAEMSSMGIGNKPCLDIKPSEDQISDRSINIRQLSRAPRCRNSIAVAPYDSRTNRNSIISMSSSSSSGSSQSSFSFYGTLNLGFEPGDSPRPLHRSLTQQSQCSTESGFCTDASTAGDCPLDIEHRVRRKKAERSDSLLSSDSLATSATPSDILADEQALDDVSITTSM